MGVELVLRRAEDEMLSSIPALSEGLALRMKLRENFLMEGFAWTLLVLASPSGCV